MQWKEPPITKVYEALGTVADGRVAISGNTAKVRSSSGNKSYDVTYDPAADAIMVNDNASYWQGYLGYPAIAFLLDIGILEFRPELADLLKGVKWKDINQRFKNDFEKALESIESRLNPDDRKALDEYAASVHKRIGELHLSLLGKKVKPPQGY